MTAHSTPAPLWIPELLFDIASHLSDLADISRFSKCNRMSHELTMPLLFRNICIPIQEAASVAYVLRKHPHYARRCSLFSFEGSSEMLALHKYPPMFEHLAAVLVTLADNAHVKSVWWCRDDKVLFSIPVPTYIWQALGRLSSSLEELRIFTTQSNENWHTICALEYPRLRMLYVQLEDPSGWDCSPLQVMLNGLPQLEYLCIRHPSFQTASGVDLSSNHPHLRTFNFSGGRLPSSFLKHHPTIERLCIEFNDGFTLDDHDLPQLKVLCVDGRTISNTPGLSARRPITHLRLNGVYNTDIHPLVRNVHATLCHLELTWTVGQFREHMSLFRLLPRLEELRVVLRPRAPLLCDDLMKLLLCFSDSTSIARLHLANMVGSYLSEPFLSDVGPAPASLRYITLNMFTYCLESREGRTVAVPAELPYSGNAIGGSAIGVCWGM